MHCVATEASLWVLIRLDSVVGLKHRGSVVEELLQPGFRELKSHKQKQQLVGPFL